MGDGALPAAQPVTAGKEVFDWVPARRIARLAARETINVGLCADTDRADDNDDDWDGGAYGFGVGRPDDDDDDLRRGCVSEGNFVLRATDGGERALGSDDDGASGAGDADDGIASEVVALKIYTATANWWVRSPTVFTACFSVSVTPPAGPSAKK